MSEQGELFEAEPVKDNIGLVEDAWDDSHGNVQQYRDLGLNQTDSLAQATRYAVGAASMCWEHPDKAGVFKSEVALDIAVQLEREVSRRLAFVVGSMMDLVSESMKEDRPLSQEELDAWNHQLQDEDPTNTMPEWLYWRFGRYDRGNGEKTTWAQLVDEDKLYWKHQAEAVERAVMRGGFKVREPGDV